MAFAPELVHATSLGEARDRRLAFAVGQVAAGVFQLVASRTYLKHKTVKASPFASIATVFASSLIFVIGARVTATQAFHLVDQPDLIARGISGILAMVVWQVFFAIVVSETHLFRRAVESLEIQYEKGRQIEAMSLGQLASLRGKVSSEISQALDRAFTQLAHRNSLQRKSAQLRELVDQVVKPLSESLLNREPDENDLSEAQWDSNNLRRFSLIRVLDASLGSRPFDIRLAPLTVATLTYFSRFWSSEHVSPPTIFAFCWLDLTLLMALGTAIQSIIQHRQSARAWRCTAIGYTLLASLFDAFATQYLFKQNSPERFIGLFTADIFGLTVTALGRGVALERKNVLKAISNATKRVEWMNSRLKQLVWVERKRLSRMLHGDIQSRIMATALSIELNDAPDYATQEALTKLRQECESALLRSQQRKSLRQFIAELRELWSATVNIENLIPEETMAQISTDQVLIDAVVELIRESVTNAVKHGKATRISITGSLTNWDSGVGDSSKTLRLDIKNNMTGKPITYQNRSVQGSALFNELCLEWELTTGNTETELVLQIPVKPI